MAGQVNPDLGKERENASFNTQKLTNFLYGGAEKVRRRRYIESLAFSDPAYSSDEDPTFMSREELYSLGLKRAVTMLQRVKELNIAEEDLGTYRNAALQGFVPGIGLHWVAFTPTIVQQATEEQKKKWLKPAQDVSIVGAYAQTEMGHGTFVRGLETTATYDPSTQEFVINSPTLTSTKWWPGGLGKTANVATVMAQLYTQEKCYGPHNFMVQLRSLEDHQPCPGVTLGDIGPKMEGNGNDNGFARFDHVRIPRENMLMKFARVEPDGTYVQPPSSKLAYSNMVYLRGTFVQGAASTLATAATIAVRYSCVRRQSEMKPGEPEPQILDYQTQQYKLFPQLAAAYAFWFAAQFMTQQHGSITGSMEKGDMSGLAELHALSAGLKSYTTAVMSGGIDVCRMACGGHGYSHASGLPALFGLGASLCTAEGENTVMMLQTARYLVKCFVQSQGGKTLTGTVAYLSAVQPSPVAGNKNMSDLGTLVAAFQHRAARMVRHAAMQMQNEMQKGKARADAWNSCSVLLIKAAEAHVHSFVVRNFAETVQTVEVDESIRAVLMSLCQLYSLHGITEHAGDFLMDGYLTGGDIDAASSHVSAMLARVRPDAVALVDAFDFHDKTLHSVLGRYDGRVYEHLYEWAKKSPLNKSEVHESYYKYLQPFLKSNRAKL
ncbi:peroxisomal acyl-coenzyme A oxidase 1-like [Branchiostoma lanceolatum]|uniref:peroxisomal acyl-coenzyme A oxidase 1-like n=1 Tax=Branchiostoma lanceolatum TaxID=7740 RepID=UPI00345712C7